MEAEEAEEGGGGERERETVAGEVTGSVALLRRFRGRVVDGNTSRVCVRLLCVFVLSSSY